MTSEAFIVNFYPDMSGRYLVGNVINKVYFEVLSDGESGLPQPLTFTKAILSKADVSTQSDRSIVINNILEKHNGRSFFEFIPSNKASYMLTVYRSGKTPTVFVLPKVDDKLTAQATLLGDNVGVYDDQSSGITVRVETNGKFEVPEMSKLVV